MNIWYEIREEVTQENVWLHFRFTFSLTTECVHEFHGWREQFSANVSEREGFSVNYVLNMKLFYEFSLSGWVNAQWVSNGSWKGKRKRNLHCVWCGCAQDAVEKIKIRKL